LHALSVENLCLKVNGHHLLENITFTIDEGEIVAIIGPNGAGKTTLIKAILGLMPYDTGSVSVFGRPFKSNDSHVRIGYVPQRLEFDRTFPITVHELLTFTIPPFYTSPLIKNTEEEEKRIYSHLAVVGAQDLIERKVGSLSGGELQRVMLAKAIVNDPTILFLDEPASGVDIEGQERFHDLVRRLNKEQGMTVILISHDLHIVYRFADNVLCMNRRLVCSGEPSKALTDEVIKSVYGEMMGGYIHSCHDHD
jgi:ABC-type Mn2+/Zn2+ transport system ATPase subunit